MKTFVLSLIFLFTITTAVAQNIYSKAFGNNKNKAIIFLHGGPGYNCATFEATTAQRLADEGFYVIVYDRRGEGRSNDPNAKFTYDETFDDLNNIYKKYNIKKSILIGHSFGGVIASHFAQSGSEIVESVFLVGAPISLQETFKTIITKSKTIYRTNNDITNLKYLLLLETMDTTSLEYSSYCFMHAMRNGFYSPKSPSEEAKKIYSTFRTDTLLLKYASQMSSEAPQGFWKNENYTSDDLRIEIKEAKYVEVKFYGLYGKEDGLYSEEQINQTKTLVGPKNLLYLENCSHNVFIDQQTLFIEAVKNWSK